MPQEKAVSAGLAYMRATKAAMPKTIGDRMRSASMHEALALAIRCNFKFNKADAQELNDRFGVRTCVGVFRALDEGFYSMACSAGGTYAGMWEAWYAVKPWIANIALLLPSYRGGESEVAYSNRVATGIGVIIKSPKEADDPSLARNNEGEVWWCTSFDNDIITLCRYAYTEERRYPLMREGSPAKRMKLTRTEWEKLNPKQEVKAAA